jgi:hypothetical protein
MPMAWHLTVLPQFLADNVAGAKKNTVKAQGWQDWWRAVSAAGE